MGLEYLDRRVESDILTGRPRRNRIVEFSPGVAELTTFLEGRITNFNTSIQVDEMGRVFSVGDGISRVYGLKEIQAREIVEFSNGVKGIALNLENENVGIIIFGSDTAIKEGDLVKRTRSIVDVLRERLCLGVWSTPWKYLLMEEGSKRSSAKTCRSESPWDY
ncbi:hypothetical protein Csa_023147 [Cucumis sativus]|nr:hypothetical protein Csa_023147 [Cucumis sativus]